MSCLFVYDTVKCAQTNKIEILFFTSEYLPWDWGNQNNWSASNIKLDMKDPNKEQVW